MKGREEGDGYVYAEECKRQEPDFKPHVVEGRDLHCTFTNTIESDMRLGGAYLVDGGAHAALQHHLQHLGVGRVLVRGEGELLRLLLHVLNCDLDGHQDDLGKQNMY